MNTYTFKNLVQYQSSDAIIKLIFALKDELYLVDETAVQNVLDLCFQKGGFIVGYRQKTPCAMMGYFWGEPRLNFANREVAFMYMAGILKPFRHTAVFLQGLSFGLQTFQAAGAREVRLQAEKANPYTNRLYRRFAKPLSSDRSLNGKEVITYGATIEAALATLNFDSRSAHHHAPHPQNQHMSQLMLNNKKC